MPNTFDCIVIGGGLVGTAIAYGLSELTYKTAIVDEGDNAYRASRGNFGLVWVQGKGHNFPDYARWSQHAAQIWPGFAEQLQAQTGIPVSYTRPGGIIPALSEQDLADHVAKLQSIRQQVGADYEFEVLDHEQTRQLMPGLGTAVVGSTYSPYDGHTNSLQLLRALYAGFDNNGGQYFANHKTTAITVAADGVFQVQAAGKVLVAEKIVLAAGLGNRELGAYIDLPVPVRPLQGQILVTERTQPLLEYPAHVIRQTNEGTFLLGDSQADVGFDTTTNTATLHDIAWRCQQILPYLGQLRIVRSWSALRVMTPDGFPIYEQSRQHPGVYAVSCHSGVTLAANHAQQVAAWIAAGDIPDQFACFNTQRFKFSPDV